MSSLMQIMQLSLFWDHYVLKKASQEEDSIKIYKKPEKCLLLTYFKAISNSFKLKSRL